MPPKIQLILEGDAKKLEAELEKVRNKLRKVEGNLAKVKDQGQKMGASSSRVLGYMKGSFIDLLGPIASVSGAIGLATKMLGEFNAERQRGVEGAKGALGGFQKLSQISAGDPNEFRRLVMMSAGISRREGVPFTESMDAVFSGRSLNLSKSEIKSLSPFARVANLEPVISGVGDVYAAFGRKEAGPALNVANKLGVTAAQSKVSMAEFAPKLSIIGAASRMIGVGDEEAMAALAFMSAGQGQSPEIGANQIRALMTAIRKSPDELGIKGMGSFIKMIKGISALDPEKRAKYFESEVRSAVGLAGLQMKLPQIEALTSDLAREQNVLAGTPGSYLQGTIRAFESAPLVRGLMENRRSAANRELSAIAGHATGQLDFDTLMNNAYSALNNRKDMSTVEQFQARFNLLGYRFTNWLGWDSRGGVTDYMGGLTRRHAFSPDANIGVDITNPRAEETLSRLESALSENTDVLRANQGFWSRLVSMLEDLRRMPATVDNRSQTFYGAPNERAQMRSPSGRRDPSTGR